MNHEENITLEAEASSREEGCLVTIRVPVNHPLLKLKRALPWEEIKRVMEKQWEKAGKNLDGGPGKRWPVSLYVPLLVLMLVKHYHSRQMEAYISESAVARLFIEQ